VCSQDVRHRQEVVVARDGVEALEYLLGTGPHAGRDTSVEPRLVLPDVSMPRVDGLETLRRIRADGRAKTLPVVMLSASNMPVDVDEAYRLGANGFVDKAVPTVARAGTPDRRVLVVRRRTAVQVMRGEQRRLSESALRQRRVYLRGG
jgi:CheY-like chemotaxis protein